MVAPPAGPTVSHSARSTVAAAVLALAFRSVPDQIVGTNAARASARPTASAAS